MKEQTGSDDGKRWLFLSQLEGHLAMWAVRQSPYHNPEKLDVVLREFRKRSRPYFDGQEMAKMDRAAVDKVLELLYEIPEFQSWNERKNGNKAPYVFVSAFEKPSPDDDIIDLGALLKNTRRSLFDELDADYIKDSVPAADGDVKPGLVCDAPQVTCAPGYREFDAETGSEL